MNYLIRRKEKYIKSDDPLVVDEHEAERWLYLTKEGKLLRNYKAVILSKDSFDILFTSEVWLTASELVFKLKSIDNEGWEAVHVSTILKERIM